MTSIASPQQRQQRVPFGCIIIGVLCFVASQRLEAALSQDRSLSMSEIQTKSTISLRKSTKISHDDASSPFNTTASLSDDATLPPLHTILTRTKSDQRHVVGNVQFLLDFAIVGFAKCGTSTLLAWLSAPPSNHTNNTDTTTIKLIQAPPHEPLWLRDQKPAKAVGVLYRYAQVEQKLRHEGKLLPHQKLLKGYKNPTDIKRPPVRDLIASYWPRTKLIITVRHPVKFLASLYNYNMIEKYGYSTDDVNLTATDLLTSRDAEGVTPHFVSTGEGEFHAILAELGKTPLLQDSTEWKLLEPWMKAPFSSSEENKDNSNDKDPSKIIAEIQQHRMPNPIFFLETRQLADQNQTRSQQFAHDLEHYLGLPRNYLSPTPLHVRPNAHRVILNQTTTEQYKMDICAPQWAPVLEEMMRISSAASQWLRRYFIRSPDVFVSSPEYLETLLEEWMINPCDI